MARPPNGWSPDDSKRHNRIFTHFQTLDGGGKQRHNTMNQRIEFQEEDGSDVLARLYNEEQGFTVTIITAPEDVLQEEGPVVNQISNDEVIIIYADEFIQRKMDAAYEKNKDEFGEMARGIGFAYIMGEAMKAAARSFDSSN